MYSFYSLLWNNCGFWENIWLGHKIIECISSFIYCSSLNSTVYLYSPPFNTIYSVFFFFYPYHTCRCVLPVVKWKRDLWVMWSCSYIHTHQTLIERKCSILYIWNASNNYETPAFHWLPCNALFHLQWTGLKGLWNLSISLCFIPLSVCFIGLSHPLNKMSE